ncbi:MAG: hypothetical protein HQL51_10365 [Magnetococcales bacterium]|nr:hypothetical protein [Magnetococcales bacterium]
MRLLESLRDLYRHSKRVMFTPIPTDAEMARRGERYVRETVGHLARGNVRLQMGLYHTAEEIQADKKAVLAHRFDQA